jgi:hypothetical protein
MSSFSSKLGATSRAAASCSEPPESHDKMWTNDYASVFSPALCFTGVGDKGKALETLQQLVEHTSSLHLAARQDLFERAFGVVKQNLEEKEQWTLSDSGSSGTALRALFYQFLAKAHLSMVAQEGGEALKRIVTTYHGIVFKAVSEENEDNAQICVKALNHAFRTVRSVVHHFPNSGIDFESMLVQVVDYFTQVRSFSHAFVSDMRNAPPSEKESCHVATVGGVSLHSRVKGPKLPLEHTSWRERQPSGNVLFHSPLPPSGSSTSLWPRFRECN